MRQLRFTDAAWRQYFRAGGWWTKHRDKAPNAFRDDIEAGLLLIRREPGVGVPVRYGRHSNVRRLYLERVRYLIYYQVVPDAIRVLAICHASRRPPRL
ncbi:MAG: toxin ParE1/3/4 [Acidobacteriota bacterium]|jgi:plasmid stabilization system protein ParE|nr:toxin ParE1/3/4 [Acidobacteriota bacterium]